jgi:uncharacterized phage infection (PIP) family protein YhgE
VPKDVSGALEKSQLDLGNQLVECVASINTSTEHANETATRLQQMADMATKMVERLSLSANHAATTASKLAGTNERLNSASVACAESLGTVARDVNHLSANYNQVVQALRLEKEETSRLRQENGRLSLALGNVRAQLKQALADKKALAEAQSPLRVADDAGSVAPPTTKRLKTAEAPALSQTQRRRRPRNLTTRT